MIMIETRGLRKSFGDHVVLDGIDLDVARATIFALLGPNGAGKTTMVQILSTLIGADAGQARVAGHNLAHEPDAVRAAIGVTGQFSAARGCTARPLRSGRCGQEDARHLLRRHAAQARPRDDPGRRPPHHLSR